MFSCEFCEVSKNGYSYRTPPVAASECSRNLEFEKQTDQNFITENLHHGDLHFEEKDTVKAMSKGGYIWIYFGFFVGWWSMFWEVIGSGGYILAGGGWWWMVVNASG